MDIDKIIEDSKKNPHSIKGKMGFLFLQVITAIMAFSAFALWAPIEYINPNFFSPFQWMGHADNIFVAASHFWPFFIWGIILGIVIMVIKGKTDLSENDELHFLLDLKISILAGIWEEGAFRCIFIMLAMLFIVMCEAIFPIIICGIILILIIAFVKGRKYFTTVDNILILLLLIIAVFILFISPAIEKPIQWFYLNIVFPVLSAISGKELDPILYNTKVPALFCMGAILANGVFRQLHSYKGFVAFWYSWILGFILIYAMMYYGLLTAIVIHAAYNAQLAIIDYIHRKMSRLQLKLLSHFAPKQNDFENIQKSIEKSIEI